MPSQPSDHQLEDLIAQAFEAQLQAYAPYSKFPVGAALLVSDGRVFRGVNVENSSYGLTLCAERTAAVAAVAAGAREFNLLAIASPGAAAPCGACRQFLWEFGEVTIALVDSDTRAAAKTCLLSELLPEGFRLCQ